MALVIMPAALANLQRGVELNETGVNVTSFSCRYYPEVNEKLPDNVGETKGRARSTKFSRDIKIEAEVTGTTGLMAATLTAAVSVANDVATFGDGTGLILLDEVTESQGRAEWRKINMDLSSNPGLTSV